MLKLNAPGCFSGIVTFDRNMVYLKMAKDNQNVDYKKLQADLEQQELEVFIIL